MRKIAFVIASMVALSGAAARGDSSDDEKFPLGVDGSLIVPANTATVLFGGKVPPNGFTIQLYGNGTPQCIVNDHGPPFNPPGTNGPSGFVIPQTGGAAPLTYGFPIFTTPPGYKPIGPVSIYCYASVSAEIRGW
jgi:hypothetical protein